MQAAQPQFARVLGRRRRWWQTGELACAFLRVLRSGLWLLLGCAVVDYLFALSPAALVGLEVLAGGWLVFALLWELISVCGFSRREMAERADQLLKLPRQPVLSAYELQQSSPAGEAGLREFLVTRTLSQAGASLAALPWLASLPCQEIARQLRLLLLAAAAFTAVAAVNAPATLIVLARLLQPGADIPPYSPHLFTVSPARAQVLYGGTLELKVEITGAPIRQAVRMLVRKGSRIDQTICFREAEAMFSQRVEKVVDPLAICFQTGKARSPWLPVELLLQPRISAAKLVIEPPAYTRLPRRETILGEATLEGYKGSRARLQLTSNRPLSRGTLTLTPLSGIDQARVIPGEKAGLHTLAFNWDIRQPARLEAAVQDVQGTALAEPLRLTQKVIPDKPPDVALHSPVVYALATPTSVVPVRGGAWDDLALRSVELVRTVVGFRDRTASLGPPLPEQRFESASELNMRRLGVLPGQVIELYLEARDSNPDRTGIGTSDIARIEVISDREYAELIRANETLDQFLARYHLVQDKLQEFRRETEELQRELAKTNPDRDKIARMLDQTRQRNQGLQKLFAQLAAEFQAYAVEAQLAEALRDMADRLQGHENLLAGMTPDHPRLPEVVNRMLRDFRNDEAALQELVARAEEIAKVGRVMEQAAAFMEILTRQRHLVRQLQRFDSRPTAGSDELRRYGRQQAEILKDLEAFLENLPRAANGLPEEEAYAELRASALEFSRQLKATDVRQDMGNAITAAENQDGRKSYHSAKLALEKLEQFLSRCQGEGSSFAGLCRDQLKFGVKEELRETIGQMLAAMLGRGSGGTGAKPGASGGGVGGDEGDGYWVPAHTRLNTPVFGPSRSTFRPGGVRGGSGRGGVGDGPVTPGTNRETLAGPDRKAVQGRGQSPELVPEKYRDALKRYFSQPEAKP